MLYRPLGKTGINLSVLGYGTLRLPEHENVKHRIDPDLSIKLMRHAFELGINLVDTGYDYCGADGEKIVGHALRGWRHEVYLSSKSPSHLIKKPGDFTKYLKEQLHRMSLDYIDIYHLDGVTYQSVQEIQQKTGWLEEAQKAKEEGLIRFISFYANGTPDDIKQLINMGIFSSILCSYNILDRMNEKAMEYAAKNGLGVIVTNPLGGGAMAELPVRFREQMDVKTRNNIELALKFVLANPDVSCALSGMSSIEKLEENIFYAGNPTPLSGGDMIKIERVINRLQKMADLYCTECKNCLPCPREVNIPYIFKLYKYLRVYELGEFVQEAYREMEINPWISGKNALSCYDCGLCEKKCPQEIRIISQLKEAHKTLSTSQRKKLS